MTACPTLHCLRRLLIGGALVAAASHSGADGGPGLSAPNGDAAGWSSRTGLTIWTPLPVPGWKAHLYAGDGIGLKPRSVGLIGDYYWHESTTPGGYTGGFRASSGVLIGPPGANWALGGTAVTATGPNYADGSLEPTAVPYLGIGYSGLSLRGGWGFSADLGVLALNPGSGLRLGRSLAGAQAMDDLVRDLQLRPLVRIGASYSF